MPDWTVVADLGTALGTLVLAIATFASVRSANRAARAAERSVLESIRPLLLPSRFQDPIEKIPFQDDHWVKVQGGHAGAEVAGAVIYLAMPLRNVGAGLAVLHGWIAEPGRTTGASPRPDPARFRRLTRDLYVPPGDTGIWQGAIRDPSDPQFDALAASIRGTQPFTVDLLYGDAEGGQRVISSFGILPVDDGDWLAVSGRHWNLDRPDPR